MKNVDFLKCGCTNFCGFDSTIEYEFKNDKLLLISGPNGVGKTTIFDTVPFSLYGMTSKGLRADDVVNNKVGKDCHTYTEFILNDVPYRVDRYVKHSKFGDTALLSKDKKVYKKGHREVIAEIEKLLVPQKLFMNTFFFGQKIKTFFTDLIDSEQKEIFRKVLQLDDYVLYQDETSKRLKKLKEDIVNLQNEISVTIELVKSGNEEIVQLELERKQFYDKKKEELENLNYLLNKARDEVRDLEVGDEPDKDWESVLSEGKVKYESTMNQISEKKTLRETSLKEAKSKSELKKSQFSKSLSDQKSEISKRKHEELQKVNQEKFDKVSGLEKNISELDSDILIFNSDIESSNLKEVSLNREINKISSGLDKDITICFACQQEVGADKIKHLKHMLQSKKDDQDQLKKNIVELKKNLQETKLERGKLTELYELNKNKFSDILKEIETRFEKEGATLQHRFEDAVNKVTAGLMQLINQIELDYTNVENILNEDIKHLKGEIKRIEDIIKHKKYLVDLVTKLKQSIASYESLIKKTEDSVFDLTRLTNTKTKVLALSTKFESMKNNLESKEELETVLDFWKEAYSMRGIPSMLIDEAIPTMNKIIKQYLEQMGGRYLVSFDTLSSTKDGEFRDKISVHVLDTVTRSNNRKAFSGGQTRLVDLATIFTLSDLQSRIQDMKVNIMLLDEVFDSLDELNITYVSKILRTIIKGRSINVISHRNIDNIECDEHYKFH